VSVDLPAGTGFPQSHEDSGQALRKLAGLFPLTGQNVADGTITDDNLASPNNTAYKTILTSGGRLGLDRGAGTFLLGSGSAAAAGQMNSSGTAVAHGASVDAPDIIHFDAAAYAVDGKATVMRVVAQVAENPTSDTNDKTVGLYSVTVGGGVDTISYTAAALVANSAVAINGAANAITPGITADFAIPADGAYMLAVVTNNPITNNSAISVHAMLQIRNI
jgi:hypothetical protein